MRDVARTITTVIIWAVMMGVITALLTTPTGAISNADGAEAFGIVFVLAAAAVVSTAMIWFAGSRDVAAVSRGKAKRRGRDRVARLVEDLDDDEVYELEALLLAREERDVQEHA